MRLGWLTPYFSALLLSLCIWLTGCRKSGQPPEMPAAQQRTEPQQQPQAQLPQQQSPQPAPAPRERLSAKSTAELQRAIGAGTLTDLRWPEFADYKSEAAKFYASLGGQLAWIADSQPTPQAGQMIQIMQHAAEKGLDPEDYDASRWQRRLDSLGGSNQADETDQVRFDLALTISAMRYVADVSSGRMNPQAFGFQVYARPGAVGRQTSSHPSVQKKSYLRDFLREQVIDAADLNSIIAEIEPQFPEYQRIEEALKKYLELARNESGSGVPGHPATHVAALPPTRHAVKPGADYAGVAQLARRLAELGEIPDEAARNMSGPKYDGDIVDAVKQFQARHGLEANGEIGPQTLRELNIPISWRVIQIQATLERWRWLPRDISPPLILINIPGYSLEAFDDDFQRRLSIAVVVGGAYEHKTPEMVSQIKTVVFRPSWNVPLQIQQKELVPKIVRQRSYLQNNDFEIIDSVGKPLSIAQVDARTIERLRSGLYKLRQKPGPENATGLIKFEFPNRDDVYLHGTPEGKLFAKTTRDLSHGCVRVADPVSLAVWVLRGNQGWDVDRVNTEVGGDKTDSVNVTYPVPVLIIYATAVANEGGETYFFSDVYGYDADFKRATATGYPHLHEAKPAQGKPAPLTSLL